MFQKIILNSCAVLDSVRELKIYKFFKLNLKRNTFKEDYELAQTSKETIKIVKIFYFHCLMDLHISRCPEHNLTVFGKFLSVFVLNARKKQLHRFVETLKCL